MLKVILPLTNTLSPDLKRSQQLFAKEAIVWSQLDHPNILSFYGIYYLGREKRMCLVSPWLENGNLVNYLQENPTVSRRPFVSARCADVKIIF